MVDYYRSPYRSRSPLAGFFRAIPPVCRWLIIACVVVFLVQKLASPLLGIGAEERIIKLFGLTPALFIRGFVYQVVSYLFLHEGLAHVGLNMLTLWMFGSEIERLWGPKRFATYYAICGVGGALMTIAVGPTSLVPTIGASGAVLGVVLAYAMTYPDRTILFNFFIPIRARHYVIVMIAFQLVILLGYNRSNIAVFAHLGGMLFGYLYLKRVWRLKDFLSEMRWRFRRRRFRVIGRDRDSGSYPFH